MKIQFYIIVDNRYTDLRFAYGEDFRTLNTGEAQHCNGCGGAISYLEWLPPYDIKISAKSKLADLVLGSYQSFLASKRFIERFKATGLKGLQNIRKVNLYFRKKLLEEEYYYSDIIKINAFIDLSRVDSSFSKPMCETCQIGYNIKNGINGIILLNPERIDQDIFCSTSVGGGTIFVSQKFKDFVDANNFTNVELIKAEDYKSGIVEGTPQWWLDEQAEKEKTIVK